MHEIELRWKAGKAYRIYAGGRFGMTEKGKKVAVKANDDGSIELKTYEGKRYVFTRK